MKKTSRLELSLNCVSVEELDEMEDKTGIDWVGMLVPESGKPSKWQTWSGVCSAAEDLYLPQLAVIAAAFPGSESFVEMAKLVASGIAARTRALANEISNEARKHLKSCKFVIVREKLLGCQSGIAHGFQLVPSLEMAGKPGEWLTYRWDEALGSYMPELRLVWLWSVSVSSASSQEVQSMSDSTRDRVR